VWRDFKDVAKILYVRTIGELQPASQQAHFSPPTPPLSCHPCNTPFWNAAPQQRDMENAWALFTIRLAHLIYNTRQRVVALLALLGQWGQHPALEPARRVAQQVAAAAGLPPLDEQGAALLALLGLAAGAVLLLRLAAVLLDSRGGRAAGGSGGRASAGGAGNGRGKAE
jgi:hypothetical protein